MDKNLKIINKIQKVRSKNNINWMNILKLAYKNDPKSLIKLLKKVNSSDEKISKLFKKIKNQVIMQKNSFIPYGRQFIDNADIKSVNKALKNNLITTGSIVQNFEKSVKKYLNSRFVLSCNSGTSALNLAMLAMNIKPSDKIIMPTINFTAAANIAKNLGAKIYLADVNENTGQMTKKTIEDCIKKNRLKK